MNASKHCDRAMTLLELLVVLAVITVLAALILPGLMRPQCVNSLRIQCVNNLKQTGLAYRIWESDHGNLYPQGVWETNGGTMEFTSGPNCYRHFQVMSNELSTPKVLLCPADNDDRSIAATNFFSLNNSNISFFVGIVSNDNIPTLILSGDHNIINGLSLKSGLLELTTNNPSRWTTEVHNKVGNILLADGSVQMVNISGLRQIVASSGVATNRIQMPILGP